MVWVSSTCGRAQTVTLSGSAIGSTPSVLGYNSGHFLPGSNTASWWKYAGVNGSRIFSSPSYLTPGTSTYFRSGSSTALNASTQAQFISQRDALRASGTATTFIRWDRITPLYATGTTDGNNSIQLKTAEDAMKALGVKPLIVMTRSPASYPWPASPTANAATDWQYRWLAWQQWYAQAFVHAQYNDVENYQFFNEPDLYASTNGTLTQDQWLEMVQFGANAVESAVADVNRLFGKGLTAHVYGPVTTGPDTAAGGWGDMLIKNRHNQLITGTSASYQLFDHYDYHNYGSSPSSFGTKVADTITALNTATGGNAAKYPVAISEFNTRTSANYDPADTVNNPNGYTPDTLDMSSRLGQILVNVANNKADELYLFKFTTAGGANNGVHWQSETGVKNVGGATRSAVAYQLFTEGFAGNTLLKAPTSSDTALTMAAAYDPTEGRRYAYIANETGTTGKAMTLDLSTWNVAVGSTVTVKQVSGLHQGGISQTLTVPANRVVTVNADPFGVVLVTAPTVSGLERRPLTAAENAYVQEGSLTTNFSGSAALLVRSGSTTATHNAAYLKFTVGSLTPGLLADATLSITALDPGATDPTTAGVICHVYGITNSAWRQTTAGTATGITWSNAPNISQSSHPTSRTTISQNYISGVGTTADIVGQFAATGTATTLSIDVSRWVAERVAAGDTSVSFMITRDVRFDGDLDHGNWLSITSREGAGANVTLAPTLTLSTRTAPITISVASGSQTQLQTGNSLIRGTSAVTKTGSGTVIYDVANSTTGTTTIQAGTLRISNADGLAGSPTVVQASGRLLVDSGIALRTPDVTLAGGTLSASTIVVNGTAGIGQLAVMGGVVAGTPAVTVSNSGRIVLSTTAAQALSVSSLAIDQSSGGRFDLGQGSLTIASGGMTLAALEADLMAGFAGGAWSGTSGIMSSAVATAQARGRSRTIGWMDSGDGTLTVSFAAAGDTNLDSMVDVLDAASLLAGGLLDSGLPAAWTQGDFNYDDVVDILDVADFLGTGLFDVGPYDGLLASGSAGGVAAVPEPAGSVVLLAAGIAATVLVRKPSLRGYVGFAMTLKRAGRPV
ncbi:MAG: DNRLRE domain-containing protein [Planctomycetaceae bacterium]